MGHIVSGRTGFVICRKAVHGAILQHVYRGYRDLQFAAMNIGWGYWQWISKSHIIWLQRTCTRGVGKAQ
jgi:hypothetical protein